MNNITLKDALQFLLIETQMVAIHSAYGKSVHSIVAKHIEDIEFANKELKVISSGINVGKPSLAERVTGYDIRKSTAKAFAISASKLEASINKVQQEFNTDLIWQNTKYCKVVTLSKSMHEAGIAKGDVFKVMRLDHDNKVWVRSDDNFACWFYSYNLLPLPPSSEPVSLTSVDTIRGRKVARELKEFRENLKVGDKVKCKIGHNTYSCIVAERLKGTVRIADYGLYPYSNVYPVDFKYAIK